MPRYYTYLISSLPALFFGAKPPFTSRKFLEFCEGFISAQELGFLRLVFKPEECLYNGNQPTLRQWFSFERDLRNELVKIRAARKHLEPQKYLRPDGGYVSPRLVHVALACSRNSSVLEAEKNLDLERWRMLEELATGHYFDIDSLIIYSQKLFILEKWEKITGANKSQLLEEALEGNSGIKSN